MIHKLTLQSVISKYYLNGLVEAVKWTVKDEILNIRFMSPSKDMLGELEYKTIGLTNIELAIFNTSQLNKLIGITAGTLLLDINKQGNIATRLNIQDSQYNLTYALADTLLIGKVAKVEEPESYVVEANLNNEQITALIKAKSALPDTTHIVISNNTDFNEDTVLEFILGDQGDFSNKITYAVPTPIESSFNLPFDANTFKEILSANTDAEFGKLCLSRDGLMKIDFKYEDSLKVTYFMVRKQEN
jgi:hypothetical protein